jgi:hypothetical protein
LPGLTRQSIDTKRRARARRYFFIGSYFLEESRIVFLAPFMWQKN